MDRYGMYCCRRRVATGTTEPMVESFCGRESTVPKIQHAVPDCTYSRGGPDSVTSRPPPEGLLPTWLHTLSRRPDPDAH